MTDSVDLLAAKAAMLRIIEDTDILKMEEEEEAVGTCKEGLTSVPEEPDFPSCDSCGEEFAGKLFCSQCRSAFYCSKECQKKHWKAPNGHKGDCTKMEEICQTKAESFIRACEELFGVGVDGNEIHPFESFQKICSAVDGLGGNGPYIKAIELGLNEKLLQLFIIEIRVVKTFFQYGLYISIAGHIFYSLFCSKRCIGNETVTCIDGYRVKQYVRSNEKAFESWFTASLQVIKLFQTQGLDTFQRDDLDSFWKIKKATTSVVCIWTHVFTNRKAAKAILLGKSKEVDVAAKERAEWIIAHINVITNNFPSIELPDKRVVEFRTNVLIAVIQLRMEEFDIDVGDFLQLLEVKGEMKLVYECLAIPMAKGAIEKGADLDPNECKQIMLQFAMSSSEGERKES
ncbi:major facilitator superfamily transporter [Chaetoceros tenuissimus]|uniref:Major facilitator superfamily transporter n=1 Tax=Chaetoceros tenuissimus TaxID=426638 RepID=A0AAD3DDI7_9STRA|nr:major facilitator superfamily transporter [Chaetoceros tenuissimus]